MSPFSLLAGALLSMGFGFVEYKKPESAQKALRRLQVSLSIVKSGFLSRDGRQRLGRTGKFKMQLRMYFGLHC